MNALYYSSHPLVEQQHNNGAFHHKGNAFAMCLSNNALEYLTKDDPIKAVVAEAYINAHNCQFSSFLCLMALSSSIKLPIESYYPISKDSQPNDTNTKKDKDTLSSMFNCTVYPREASANNSQNEKIHLFRCAALPLNYLVTAAIPERKNHYVALCQAKENTSLSPENFLIKPLRCC